MRTRIVEWSRIAEIDRTGNPAFSVDATGDFEDIEARKQFGRKKSRSTSRLPPPVPFVPPSEAIAIWVLLSRTLEKLGPSPRIATCTLPVMSRFRRTRNAIQRFGEIGRRQLADIFRKIESLNATAFGGNSRARRLPRIPVTTISSVPPSLLSGAVVL
ncbi:hypothetical protein QP185_21705 [Sphingomonas aerolata]|uniref:hypothetical protein n=1 Tax=Sphingomonas aerolata TaxID=185951 RepID=UPI002FDFB977